LLKLRFAGRELLELDQVASALLDALPGAQQLAEVGRLTGDLPRPGRVVPDPGLD